MIMIRKVLCIVLPLIILLGCSNSIVKYTESKYPKCQVEQIESSSTHTIVRIKCPGEPAFEKTFRSNK